MVETIQENVEHQDHEVRVPCEVYSRIVGYLRPVQAWNHGKRQEFIDRKTFDVPQDSGSS
jgi:anaerobic ribonucleoside-triphosphate reductase